MWYLNCMPILKTLSIEVFKSDFVFLMFGASILLFPIINECTRTTEPSPQVWFGKREWFSRWQENNCRQYLTVIIIIIIIILRLYYICVCALWLTLQVLLRVLVQWKQFCGFNHMDEMGGARNWQSWQKP